MTLALRMEPPVGSRQETIVKGLQEALASGRSLTQATYSLVGNKVGVTASTVASVATVYFVIEGDRRRTFGFDEAPVCRVCTERVFRAAEAINWDGLHKKCWQDSIAEVICPTCKQSFKPRKPGQRYDSQGCSGAANIRGTRRTTGASGEHFTRVIHNLLAAKVPPELEQEFVLAREAFDSFLAHRPKLRASLEDRDAERSAET